MLDNENLDLLVVTSPSGLHHDHTIKAAKKGLHILCEKPLATRLNDAQDMINICDENNVKLWKSFEIAKIICNCENILKTMKIS